VTPHLLSRGGYKMLEQKLVEQNIRAHSASIKEGNNVDSLNPQSPPSRHEKWKSVCLKPLGTWTSQESQRTTEQIVRNMISVCYFKFNVF